MERIKIDDIIRSYYDCRRHKRNTINALDFELNLEKNILDLWREINSGTYKISRSIAFIVAHPVKREVFAADFRDRIVHHLVINKINQLFEREFIPDSYSCRAGKGTLFGVERVRKMLLECSRGGTRDCYILKLDIRSFFMSIDKRILYKRLRRFLAKRYKLDDFDIILSLIKQIIFNNPEDNCIIKGSISDWNGLPYYKSLFWSNRYCGLPIGNLTSQIFANFYLNDLDKYITKGLGIKYYGRYVDDFVLIHEDKEVLKSAHRKIEDFLQKKLHLTLHPQKVYLQHYSKGVKFIGAMIKPDFILIGKRTKGNMYKKIHNLLLKMSGSLDQTLENLPHFSSSINSYLGFMKHYNTYNLRQKVKKNLATTFIAPVIDESKKNKLAIDKRFMPLERKKRIIRRQRQYRRWQNKQPIKENKK